MLTAFLLGVVSSLHCAQMCGPIVLSYTVGRPSGCSGLQPATHLCYNAGRIITYSFLGAIAGLLGQSLVQVAGFQQTAAIVSGTLMVIAGILLSPAVPSSRLIQIGVGPSLTRPAAKLLLANSPLSKLQLGLLMGFLPCGLVYAALLKAASTGSPLSGAGSMAAFGLGTSGTLLAIGLFSSGITLRLGRWSNTLASASVVLMGIVLVWRGVIAEVSCHAGV